MHYYTQTEVHKLELLIKCTGFKTGNNIYMIYKFDYDCLDFRPLLLVHHAHICQTNLTHIYTLIV